MKIWNRPRVATLAGRVRQWLAYLLGYEAETCQWCGRAYDVVWWCEDPALWEDVYEKVTGWRRGEAGLLCPACFERGARQLSTIVIWHARKDGPAQ